MGTLLKWKADSKGCEVRQVGAEPYPGKDSEGAPCFANTHFDTRQEAEEKLGADARSCVCLCGHQIQLHEAALADANERAGHAAKRLNTVDNYLSGRRPTK